MTSIEVVPAPEVAAAPASSQSRRGCLSNDGGVVPDDFLILIGVAASFLDPDFRAMAKQVARKLSDEGFLDDIIHHVRPN